MADRFEDMTSTEEIRMKPNCERTISLYGYVRGCNLKRAPKMHIAGVGDCDVESMVSLDDPCPLPSVIKKRTLNDRERMIYAPMSDVGGILYDKDAIYIDLKDKHVVYTKDAAGSLPEAANPDDEGEEMVRKLQDMKLKIRFLLFKLDLKKI